MGEIYGGHLVAKYLKEAEGITTVFGLCGGHIDRILDGFLEYGIRFVDVRHEQSAVMMAHAWSVLRAEPSVCLVTAGPGFTNAISGIANAYFDNAPVVVISGTAPVRDWDKGALQDMNQSEMIKSTAKWTGFCHDAKRIPEYLSRAIRHAVSGCLPVKVSQNLRSFSASRLDVQSSMRRRSGLPARALAIATRCF